MTRTQVYLPEELHQDLLLEAKLSGTTLSELIRLGSAKELKSRRSKRAQSQPVGLSYFANPPKDHLLNLPGKDVVALIRKSRDDED